MAKKFRIIDYSKPGKGVTKEEIKKQDRMGLKEFFLSYKHHFWKLVSLNLIYVLANIPIVFGIVALSGNFNGASTAPSNVLYAPLLGAAECLRTPGSVLLMGIYGTQVNIAVMGWPTYLLYGLTLLVVFTFGIANAGMAYVLRGMTRGDHVLVWKDFWGCVKKNFGKAMGFGILDALILAVLGFDIIYLNFYSAASLQINVMFVISMGVGIFYFLMRFYMYLLLITFNLSTFKILKNSFIFSLINIKRNAVATVGIIVVVALNALILRLLTGIGILLPFVATVATCGFMATYAAWKSVHEVMIAPYYKDEPDDGLEGIEPIFTDRG